MTEVHLDKFISQGNDPFRISSKEYASIHDQTRADLSPLYHVWLFKNINSSDFWVWMLQKKKKKVSNVQTII